jgi:hypothetical protein
MKFSIGKILLVLPLALTLGCSDFLDVNQSPNNPLAVPPNTLLPSGLAGSAFANANELNRFASTVTSYLAGAGGSPALYDTYVLTGTDFGNQWNGEIYNGSLIAYKKMIEEADKIGAKAYSGIGKIMTAYTFALATDIWGDIPYSQALQGDKGITRPRLDTQEDIYKGNATLGITSLFDMIRDGEADLNAATTQTPKTDDIVYGGNMTNWKKAGYTLMIKLALQMSAKEPALAASIINEAISQDYIKTNAENLGVKFGSAVGSQSPIYTYMFVSLFTNELIVSTRYVNLLTGLNDPRLPLFVTKPGASYVTIDNGFRGTLPSPTANWSRWNTAVTGASGAGPVKLITNAMRCFMLSEAALTIPGVILPAGQTAQTLFQEGIKASLTDAGVTSAAADTYAGTSAAPTGVATLTGSTSNQLNQIITQKYIAMTGNGLEAWNDWRRTGFPTLPPHQNAAGEDGTRPLRARYLDAEVTRNPNFNPVRKTNENVWWDVN